MVKALAGMVCRARRTWENRGWMKYTVAVRTLCEFTAKLGDLDLRFTPSPTALEGMAGHAMVAARRGDAYESEVWLKGEHRGLAGRGRADGFDPDAGRLDEVKTYRGDLHAMPANRRSLHWAQARCCGALLCAERGLTRLSIALVYFDVASQDETMLVESFSADELLMNGVGPAPKLSCARRRR